MLKPICQRFTEAPLRRFTAARLQAAAASKIGSTHDRLDFHGFAQPPSARVRCRGHRTGTAFAALTKAIETAAVEYREGKILSPERMVVPMGQGGVMLSMPATSHDIGIHKLVNVHPGNAALKLPTIHGIVTVRSRHRPTAVPAGRPRGHRRRTAAVSMVAIHRLLGHAPRQVLLIGTGVQARHHIQALQDLYPDCTVWVQPPGRHCPGAVRRVCRARHGTGLPCGNP